MKVTIQDHTTKNPITMMGREAGICWGADLTSQQKNYKRGLQCMDDNHGRVIEYPQIYFVLEDCSARMMRELYTHIGGGPSRLQASTRYIDYAKDFDYIIPPKIEKNEEAKEIYERAMHQVANALRELDALGSPREDIANLLPLGMKSKMVMRTNLRHLIDMSRQRMCTRAYWEFRDFMKVLAHELAAYDEEYQIVVANFFGPKCDFLSYCPEKFSCGRWPKGSTRKMKPTGQDE